MKYTVDNIEVLQNIEHIRKRPMMYIQNTSLDGLHQLCLEILNNSVDEFMNGHVSKIIMNINDDQVEIIDDGRGIPYEIHPKTKMSTLTTVLTYTGSGGKFDHKTYSVSAGLHGVGMTVVNALSEWLEVTSATSMEKMAVQGFKFGVPESDIKVIKNTLGHTGLVVKFNPDSGVFGKTKINLDTVNRWAKELSYLCPNLELVVNGESYLNKHGLRAYLSEILDSRNLDIVHDPVYIKTDLVDAAFVWTDGEEEVCHSFVNCSRTPEGGTHVVEFRRAVSKAFGDNTGYQNDDIRVGLVSLIHVKLADPEFKGQTKSRLLNKESGVFEAVIDPISKFVVTNDKIIKEIVGRAVRINKARELVKKEKRAIRGIVRRKKGILPGKLAESPKAKPADRELYLVEGDGAGGSAKKARDASYQEVLPLRGKIPNASRSNSILNNEEIQAIISAVGCGIGEDCNVKNSRIGKLILLMDADPDGKHITALVLNFIYRYMKNLIENGMVYTINSPLFVAASKDERYFGYTLDEVVKKAPKNSIVSRIKGHGECDAKELRNYAFSTKTRRLYKIEMKDFENIDAIMGDDSLARKEILGIEV